VLDELEQLKRKFVMPVVKIGESKTYAPWDASGCPAVAIKIQDLFQRSGLTPKPVYADILKAGGIHAYLKYPGPIFLSTVMRDQTIRGFSRERYAACIAELRPDYYFTPDGETYLGEENLSRLEIERIMDDTTFLLDACPTSKPVGMVKGCTRGQVLDHSRRLLEMGIQWQVFHAGDYICRGKADAIAQASMLAKQIKQHVPWLLIYGIGANSHFRRFFFADGFITQSHFVNAFYGQQMIGGRWRHFRGLASREIIMKNLVALEENVNSIVSETKLTQWIESERAEQIITVDERCRSLQKKNEKEG